MSIPTLPLVAPTATSYVVPCDSHYEEIPASREIHYVALPGTPDEHGSSLAICDDQACEDKARAYIADIGDVIEIVPITGPAEVFAATGPLHLPSSNSGVTFGGDCTHVAPDSCPHCDGTVAELRWRPGDDRHEVLPPCMQGEPAA